MQAKDDQEYMLLMPVSPADLKMPINVEGATCWLVARARPVAGSTTARELEGMTLFQDTPLCDEIIAMEMAVEDFFKRMRQHGLTGVLDAGEIRAYARTPLDFCDGVSNHISDAIPDIEDPDARDDDFDNHPLSPLREAMVDHCPEYSGSDAPALEL